MAGFTDLIGGIVPNSGGNGSKGRLASNVNDPTKIGASGNPISRINSKMVLPNEISATQVVKARTELAKVEAEVELAKEQMDYQSKEVDELIKLQGLNVAYSQKMMNAKESLAKLEAGHGRAVAQFQLGSAVTQASLDGYQEIYNMGSEIFG